MKIYEDHSEFKEDSGNYTVKNWQYPQLWETMLPHDSIPRLSFKNNPVPLHTSQDTIVHDLTFTEGRLWNQLGDDHVLTYFDLVRKLSGSRGVVRYLEVPLDDSHRLDTLLERHYQFPEIVLRVTRDTKVEKVPVGQVVCDFAGSDFYLQGALHTSREDELKAIQRFVSKCFECEKVPVVRLLDVSRGAAKEYLFGLVLKLRKMADEADFPVRLRLVDSLGLFSAHPSVSLPRGLPLLLHHFIDELGYPGEWVTVEAANDMGQAATVSQSTWLYGAAAVGVTLGGRGPRAGLASLESALADILAIRSDAPRINLTLLKELEQLVSKESHVEPVGEQNPYLGEQVFQPRSADVAEVDILSNCYDPAIVWGVCTGQQLTSRSSCADVAKWLKNQLGQGVMISPEHPGVVKLTDWVASRASDTVTDKELMRQARRYLPGFFVMEGTQGKLNDF